MNDFNLPLKAYVVNLARRPDRLRNFQREFSRAQMKVTVFPAIDGRDLELSGPLRDRINEWNFRNLSEVELRGVVGCALSHLGVWREIASREDNHLCLVLEDDAVFLRHRKHLVLDRLVRDVPADAAIVWLNEYDRLGPVSIARRVRQKFDRMFPRCRLGLMIFRTLYEIRSIGIRTRYIRWTPEAEKTTEAYLISPTCAAFLVEKIEADLGAIDECMRSIIKANNLTVYEAIPALFYQNPRVASDIQI